MSDDFKRDIDLAIEADDPDELLSAVIDIALASDDVSWATDRLLALADHHDTDVRGNAIIAFTHLAGRFEDIDRERILPVVRAACRDSEQHVREQAEAALEEL